MFISRKKLLKDTVLENLMAAHKRLSMTGNSIHLVILTRYLLHLIQKCEDELMEIVSEQK